MSWRTRARRRRDERVGLALLSSQGESGDDGDGAVAAMVVCEAVLPRVAVAGE